MVVESNLAQADTKKISALIQLNVSKPHTNVFKETCQVVADLRDAISISESILCHCLAALRPFPFHFLFLDWFHTHVLWGGDGLHFVYL